MPNNPEVVTGEVQGKADTEKALASYRGAVTTYQDDAGAMKQEAEQCRATARRLADGLAASELGPDTVQAAAGCAEWADILDRAAEQLIAECEAVLAVIVEFEGAVAAHDAVEAAALANQDGGTTDFHRE